MADKQPPKKYITSQELSTHNKKSDLWISIQGKVYNATTWADLHPGGDLPLLNLAGQDVTDAFVAYHPASAWSHLEPLFTGFHLSDHTVSDVSKDYRRLVSEFTKMGLFDNKGHRTLFVFCFTISLFLISLYGILFCQGFWVHLLCGALIGFMWIQSGWLGHDSGHYQIMTTRKLTRFAQVLTGNCLAGISIAWWKRNHNYHHIACNSLEHDPDLQHMPFFVVSNKFFGSLRSYYYERVMKFDAFSRFLVSYQHWSFYPVMGLARINLFAQSFMLLLSKNKVPNRVQELFGILVFWVWYPILVAQLPNWGERVAFVLASFAVTGIQHVQFCLNHFSSEVYLGAPTSFDWFEKQTHGTMDITCPTWMDWFHGGLQFQIAHHLFPRLPVCHLRTVTPFVRDLCKKHGLPYDATSFWMANVRTVNVLRNAALQARDLSSPVPKNLVWEAVNTHG